MIELKRVSSTEKGTFGVLLKDKIPLCVTCEDPWKDNQKQISCIPEGTYKVIPHSGEKFKDVWEVTGVKDRSAILIHQGNTVLDTHGCILVGSSFTSFGSLPGIGGSRDALNFLREILPKSFTLEVRNEMQK